MRKNTTVMAAGVITTLLCMTTIHALADSGLDHGGFEIESELEKTDFGFLDKTYTGSASMDGGPAGGGGDGSSPPGYIDNTPIIETFVCGLYSYGITEGMEDWSEANELRLANSEPLEPHPIGGWYFMEKRPTYTDSEIAQNLATDVVVSGDSYFFTSQLNLESFWVALNGAFPISTPEHLPVTSSSIYQFPGFSSVTGDFPSILSNDKSEDSAGGQANKCSVTTLNAGYLHTGGSSPANYTRSEQLVVNSHEAIVDSTLNAVNGYPMTDPNEIAMQTTISFISGQLSINDVREFSYYENNGEQWTYNTDGIEKLAGISNLEEGPSGWHPRAFTGFYTQGIVGEPPTAQILTEGSFIDNDWTGYNTPQPTILEIYVEGGLAPNSAPTLRYFYSDETDGGYDQISMKHVANNTQLNIQYFKGEYSRRTNGAHAVIFANDSVGTLLNTYYHISPTGSVTRDAYLAAGYLDDVDYTQLYSQIPEKIKIS